MLLLPALLAHQAAIFPQGQLSLCASSKIVNRDFGSMHVVPHRVIDF